MKEIYLIRHTTPAVVKGTCYGQTDLELTESFPEEASIISRHLPENIAAVHSSPLKRCALLARYLFPEHPIMLHDALMEIHCGDWEMKHWDSLPREVLDPWMNDFVHVRIPGGESYLELHDRVTRCFNNIPEGETQAPIAIIAHGGVIRSILSYITNTPLIDSFKVFSLHYGCVIRLYGEAPNLSYDILSNLPGGPGEQHKPKSFY